MVELHILYPPTTNGLWTRANKGMRLTDKYRDWLDDAGRLATAQHAGCVNGPYKITIQAVRPDRKRRDLDNIIKPISDLLVKIGAVTDDCLCEFISARWVTEGEGVYVRIEPAGVEA